MVDLPSFNFNDDEPVVMVQPHYKDHPLKRDPSYRGLCHDLTEENAREILDGLIRYFGIDGFDGMPNPPIGLPGTAEMYEDYDVKVLMRFGFNYFLAMVDDKPRRRLNLWNDAEQFLKRQKSEAANEMATLLLSKRSSSRAKR